MYSTCIFCHTALGANESIESFPVGRRLAFDAERGRLWVVCRRCERWNLTPVEERWEAIEECERAFRATRLRVSTDNVGLARLREGLELVRVGRPRRPEMAAWRYGDQFGRRRNRHLLYTGAGLGAAAGLMVLGPITGVIAGGSWVVWNVASAANSAYQAWRVRARLVLPGSDRPAAIRMKQLNRVSIVALEQGWGLSVPYESALPGVDVTGWRKSLRLVEPNAEFSAVLTGDAAIQAAGKLLPAINNAGAGRKAVDAAVSIIEDAAGPDALFSRYRTFGGAEPAPRHSIAPPARLLSHLPTEVRLALEMATHEESERRALEGELALLEDAWREAEEIAAIADDLFVNDDTRGRLASLKRDAGEP